MDRLEPLVREAGCQQGVSPMDASGQRPLQSALNVPESTPHLGVGRAIAREASPSRVLVLGAMASHSPVSLKPLHLRTKAPLWAPRLSPGWP